MKKILARMVDFIFCKITIFITGVRPPRELREIKDLTPKIYYANHTSHGDFLLLFVSMPYALRKRIRPVAAADYWSKGKIRPFLAKNVFNMLLIDRNAKHPLQIIEQMSEALKTHSLIIFPEGTRKTNDDLQIGSFKSGIFRLCEINPQIPLVPVWINNARHGLPKGFFVPIPLICELRVAQEFKFGGEDRAEFLQKAQNALLAMKDSVRKRGEV
ncbi:MAG: 1-acyl-sn-glycerol-3-phosphate acyltransferase [Campylobacter sp.]|nr:1-acyl-sn-glycerol-3-phosphate acyltransferase [Campylobacter sp.]